ncbi:MAG: PilZ domain-containing protein [Desulfobacteraceae bacterium]|nr:PilZ domain-containing protein [Desulfobacteraceae bacterium]
MSFDEGKEKQRCPHFVKGMQSCGLYAQGFYMPLREHVVAYCLSRRHRQCTHYNQQAPPGDSGHIPPKSDGIRERRSHHRFREESSVVLCTCDEQGNTVGDFHETASAMDFSQAGLRVKTRRKLPPGKPLLCRFPGDFCVPFLRGIALVCWQKETGGNDAGMEAGLFFYDSASRTRLAREVGY